MNAVVDRRRVLALMASSAAVYGLGAGNARAAVKLELDGRFTQGGMVIGRTDPDARVLLGEKRLRVGANGVFVFGFGRDHVRSIALTVTGADGAVRTESLGVEQRTYEIQRIDNLPEGMVTPPDEVLARIKRENGMVAAARAIDTDEEWFAGGFDWPVTGIVTGVYGSQRILNGTPKQPHFGVDLAKPEGTPILSPQTGRITLAEKDFYYTGGTVIIDHGFGISTCYLHMSRVDVTVGDKVEKGQEFGAVGKTGRATGPHLCWRMNWFQERLDAQLAAPAAPAMPAQPG